MRPTISIALTLFTLVMSINAFSGGYNRAKGYYVAIPYYLNALATELSNNPRSLLPTYEFGDGKTINITLNTTLLHFDEDSNWVINIENTINDKVQCGAKIIFEITDDIHVESMIKKFDSQLCEQKTIDFHR